MNVRHLIITRFNIRIDRDIDYVMTDEWMQTRLSLFEQYCLPSVAAQTCQDFTWLVLMNQNTAATFRQRMVVLSQQCPMMRIVDAQPITDLSAFYQQLMQSYTRDVDYLLTTRLDSDDMLSPFFVEEVRKQVQKTSIDRSMLFSFRDGVQLFVRDQVSLSVDWIENHFVSLCEPTSTVCHSVLDYDHLQIRHLFPIVVIHSSDPAWAEVVHSCNVINSYTPHLHYQIPKSQSLPFPGEWCQYLNAFRNGYFRMLYHIRYRRQSVANLYARLFRAFLPN